MKKLCILLLSICLMISFCLSVNANDTITGNSNYTVIFAEDSCFNEQEQEQIKNFLTGDTTGAASTYNLLCTLFGHKYQTEYITGIRHEVYADEPRCIEEVYELEICTRCSDMKSTMIAQSSIFCCPEEN